MIHDSYPSKDKCLAGVNAFSLESASKSVSELQYRINFHGDKIRVSNGHTCVIVCNSCDFYVRFSKSQSKALDRKDVPWRLALKDPKHLPQHQSNCTAAATVSNKVACCLLEEHTYLDSSNTVVREQVTTALKSVGAALKTQRGHSTVAKALTVVLKKQKVESSNTFYGRYNKRRSDERLFLTPQPSNDSLYTSGQGGMRHLKPDFSRMTDVEKEEINDNVCWEDSPEKISSFACTRQKDNTRQPQPLFCPSSSITQGSYDISTSSCVVDSLGEASYETPLPFRDPAQASQRFMQVEKLVSAQSKAQASYDKMLDRFEKMRKKDKTMTDFDHCEHSDFIRRIIPANISILNTSLECVHSKKQDVVKSQTRTYSNYFLLSHFVILITTLQVLRTGWDINSWEKHCARWRVI